VGKSEGCSTFKGEELSALSVCAARGALPGYTQFMQKKAAVEYNNKIAHHPQLESTMLFAG